MSTTLETRARSSVTPRKPAGRPSNPAGWHRADVIGQDGSGLRLRLDTRELPARQAFSCLVTVQPGDVVAALVDEQAQCWVMAVLERSGPQDVELRSEGALHLKADSVGVDAAQSMHLTAAQLRVNFEQADAVGERVNLVASTCKAIGATLSTLFDRVHHHSKQYTRHTDGLDRTQAEHVELQARQLLQIHSEHALIDGEKLVKARGSQIHFG